LKLRIKKMKSAIAAANAAVIACVKKGNVTVMKKIVSAGQIVNVMKIVNATKTANVTVRTVIA
jgi:hypothetical protein